MKPNSNIGTRRGFSLLEVLIAVVILSIGLLALAALQASMIRSSAESKTQTVAMGLAEEKLEQLTSYREVGGLVSTCVSPSTSIANSCYRAIDTETTVSQTVGGVTFSRSTAVSRYVFNRATTLFAGVANTALDTAFATPTTYIPGKEFKRVVVTVTWTGADGQDGRAVLEDAISGISPADSLAVSKFGSGGSSRKAQVIIQNPAAEAGVIPIAVGNGSSTAASNPTPELLGKNNQTYVAETRFNVYTYKPLSDTTALAQARVETSVVGCKCDTGTRNDAETGFRPTYWDGARYAVPIVAGYTSKAGEKNLSSSDPPQSEQCHACCRDHRDPSGNDSSGKLFSLVKFSPRASAHDHYVVDDATGARTLANSGVYSEVCRLIRVDGIFRVAADLSNDYFGLLQAKNSTPNPFAPSGDVSDDYGDFVTKYLKSRVTNNAYVSSSYPVKGSNPTYGYNERFDPSASPANLSPNGFEAGTRLLSDGITSRAYDLNQAAIDVIRQNDTRWLHSRGLYIDYLEPVAIAVINKAKTDCAVQPAGNDCVLPYLPFTSINLSELAEWRDVNTSPAAAPGGGSIISVLNNGFKTSITDPNPVRGLVTTTTGNVNDTAEAVATATSANSVLALKFPTNDGERPTLPAPSPANPPFLLAADAQAFHIIGSPTPDGTAGVFRMNWANYTFGTPYPVVEWLSSISSAPCPREGTPLPYRCDVSSGLNGVMQVRLSGYNTKITKTESFSGRCQKPNRDIVDVSGSTVRPYCVNFKAESGQVAWASNPGLITAIATGSSPYAVAFDGKAGETSTLTFNPILKNSISPADYQLVTISVVKEGETPASFISCTAGGNGGLDTVTWSDPCQ